MLTRFPGFRHSPPLPVGNGYAALTIGGRRKIKYPRLASPSFRAQSRNLWNLAVWTSTAPESTFVASACECGVAVQGDGHMRRALRFSKGRHHFENMFPSTGSGNGPLQSRTSCSLLTDGFARCRARPCALFTWRCARSADPYFAKNYWSLKTKKPLCKEGP